MPEVAGEAGAYCDTKSAESFMTRIEHLAYDSTERKRYSELRIDRNADSAGIVVPGKRRKLIIPYKFPI